MLRTAASARGAASDRCAANGCESTNAANGCERLRVLGVLRMLRISWDARKRKSSFKEETDDNDL